MKKEKEDNFIDDGRTIIDMSGVERPALFGRNYKAERAKRRELETPKEEVEAKPWEQDKDKMSKEDRRAVIKGALGASFLIWLCYAVVFGIVILIMYFIFKGKLGI